ncbi:uncharacterized protein MELLADRAFT_115898 [Melampsora larici-populina 98AG31]|uniref:BTB domain-containing protein n=1 Tax=Melampsora larici-populina (strain 98AG31 / pathotype 3-4-7) TaxID=747676 RepID=F4RFK1_MELLP|nr:uncharacterized protein MELLADRAFT_115898 [Melampsora larici-populina 98AG31]EGG08915.1 hypothetical protein MELLADRAFT_115898 [Melampsora larici-populina 98AG31]
MTTTNHQENSTSIGIYNLVPFSNTTANASSNQQQHHQQQPQQPQQPSISQSQSQSQLTQSTSTSNFQSSNHLNLTNHLFRFGLLNSQFNDIRIKCFGRVYQLHRLVLSQVDFFHALFSGPWNESTIESSKSDQPLISIRFPPQVNRSSFEYCLSHLYGHSPLLVPPPWAYVSGEPLLLGRTHSLLTRAASKSPPNRWVNISDEELAWEQLLTIPNLQPASPTFLVSLLVCSDYLGMSDLAQDTIQLIRKTITPFTIVRYLTFSDGRSIDDEMTELERNQSCSTLEQISQLDPITTSSTTTSIHELQVSRNESFEFIKESNLNSEHQHHSIEDNQEEEDIILSHGAPAQQIGQACASWLSKWSTELLSLEEALIDQDEFELLPIGSHESRVLERWPWLKRPEMRIWREIGGLSSKWIRVLISSDALFISRDISGPIDQSSSSSAGIGGEWERYGLARRVVELRERERMRLSIETGFQEDHPTKILPDPELCRIFEDGIYFSHLTFEQLSFISNDRSSITNQKFVRSKSLQRAHWLATEFRGKLSQDHHLTHPIQDLHQDDLPVYVIPEDRTSRLDELNTPSQLTDSFFFGLGRDMITSLPIPTDVNPNRLYTRFEPKRFSAEFVNLSRLRERDRLYSLPPSNVIGSNTILYAGSKFSCYLQRVRQGSLIEPQLGVYVHRLSEGIESEQDRMMGADSNSNSNSNASMALANSLRQLQLQPSVGTHSLFGEGSRLRSALGPRALTGTLQHQHQHHHSNHHSNQPIGGKSNGDSNPNPNSNGVIDAYFVLRVGTMDGTSGTIFESAPDGFAKSQSWGYRSRSMMGEEYLGISSKEIEGVSTGSGIGKTGSLLTSSSTTPTIEDIKSIGKHSVLRCTVVIGVT